MFLSYRSELGRGASVPDWQAGNYVIIRCHGRVHGRAVPYTDAKYWVGHQLHGGPNRSHAGAVRAPSGETSLCVISSFKRRNRSACLTGRIISGIHGFDSMQNAGQIIGVRTGCTGNAQTHRQV